MDARSATATPDKIQLGAFCVSRARRRQSDVSSLRTRAVYDEKPTTSGCMNGTKAWITNGGIADIHVVVAAVDPELQGPWPGVVHRAAQGTKGLSPGPEVQEARHPCVSTPLRSCSTTCACPARACSVARSDKLDAKLATARDSVRALPFTAGEAAGHGDVRGHPPDRRCQALGIARAAYEYSLQYAKERQAFGKPIIMNQAIAFKLANMATEIDASPSAHLACRVAREERWLQERRGLDEQVEGLRGRRARDRGRDPDPRWLRLHP